MPVTCHSEFTLFSIRCFIIIIFFVILLLKLLVLLRKKINNSVFYDCPFVFIYFFYSSFQLEKFFFHEHFHESAYVANVESYTINLLRPKEQKQPFRGVPTKRCSENTQQIYRNTPIPSN